MSVFPGAVATDSDLYVAVNNLQTTLTDSPLSDSATTINVDDTTGFPSTGCITIDSEIISYAGTTATSFTGCTRGFDGTTNVSHEINSYVSLNQIAAHHNVLKDEIKAIETKLFSKVPYDCEVLSGNGTTSAVSGKTYLVSFTPTASRAITLPTPSLNAFIIVKDIQGTFSTLFPCTIQQNGSEKIEGSASSYPLTVGYGTWYLISDGTDWYSIGATPTNRSGNVDISGSTNTDYNSYYAGFLGGFFFDDGDNGIKRLYSNFPSSYSGINFMAEGVSVAYFVGLSCNFLVETSFSSNIFVSGFISGQVSAMPTTGDPVDTPTNQDIRFDASSKKLYVYDGGTWNYIELTNIPLP